MQNYWLLSSKNIYFRKCQTADEKKKSEEDEQTLEESNSAHRRSQPKWQLLQTCYLKRVKLLLFSPYNKHLINRPKSVCMGESWPRSCVQTSLRSVCTYDLGQDSPIQTSCSVKAGVNVKAVFTSLNTAFLPISRSRFKRRQIPMLKTLSTIWQFCVNFWVIFRCFGKERFFLKG